MRGQQKVLIAAAAILAMFAFVISPLLVQLGQTNYGDDATVASVGGREISQREFTNFQRDRQVLNRFFREARQEVGATGLGPQFSPEPERVEEAFAEERLADELGVEIDDEQVAAFIREQTDGKLTDRKFNDILFGTPEATTDGGGGGLGVTLDRFFEIVRRELRLRLLAEAVAPAASRTSPFDAYSQLSQPYTFVKLALAAAPVAEFVDADAKPTESELEQVYQQYADVPPDPTIDRPGFQQPRTVDGAYFLATADAFAGEVQVTDSEVEAYYEANKAAYVVREQPQPAAEAVPEEEPIAPPVMKDATGPATGEPATPPAEGQPAPAQPKPEEPMPATPDAPKPDAPKLDTPKVEEPKPEEPKPAAVVEQPSAQPASEEPKPAEDGKDTAAAPTTAPQWFVSMQDEPPAAADDPADGQELKISDNVVLPPAGSDQPQPAAASAPQEASPAAQPAEPKYRPLEEVRDEIVQTLKRRGAADIYRKRMQEVLDEVMHPYSDAYTVALQKHVASEGGLNEAEFQPPSPPDFQAVAKKYGFEYRTIENATRSELNTDQNLGGMADTVGYPRETLAQAAFQSDGRGSLYMPRVFGDPVAQRSVMFWKTADKEPVTAPLDEIRDRVIAAWRAEQALPAAMKAAEDLKEKIEESDEPLAEVVPADSRFAVDQTPLFPRSRRSTRNPFGPSGPGNLVDVQLAQVPSAGPTFLDQVFDMDVGDVRVLTDAPEKNVYVVKVTERKEAELGRVAGEYVQALESEKQFRGMRDQQPQRPMMAENPIVAHYLYSTAGLPGYQSLAPSGTPDQPPAEPGF